MCRNFSIKWVENVIKLSDLEKQKNSPMLFSGARSVNECAPSLSAWWALVLLSLDLSCAPTETKTSARKRLSRQRFWILPLLSLAESKLQYWLKAAQARVAAAAAQLYFLEITRFLISDSIPVNFSTIIRDNQRVGCKDACMRRCEERLHIRLQIDLLNRCAFALTFWADHTPHVLPTFQKW